MYKTMYDKNQIFDFIIESASYASNVLDRAMLDQNFNVYIEHNLQTKDNFLRGDLVIERNSFGDAIHTLYESHRIKGDLAYYVTVAPHILAKDVRNLYMKANSRKREHKREKSEPMTGEEFTDMLYGLRTRVTPDKVVYYICNLGWSPTRNKHVTFLYKHPAFNKIEFVDADTDSRCTWFYSEKEVKDFIAKHGYCLNIECENAFVVKAVVVGNKIERTFYNLDLNEERYDLYGPVESCYKRLARHSQIGEREGENKIYFHNTASRGYGIGAYSNYFKMDAEAVRWSQEYLNKQMKEIMEEMKLPKIKKVIFNKPATIVFWGDESKTVVRCENEEFDPEKGLSMAISKKALGNHHDYYNVFKKWLPKEKKEDKKTTTKKPSNKKNNK